MFGSERHGWIRGFGFSFTNPMGTGGGVLDVCLYFGGVCGEWVGGLEQGLDCGWYYVCVSCESGFILSSSSS